MNLRVALVSSLLALAAPRAGRADPQNALPIAQSLGSSAARQQLTERVASIVARAGVGPATPGCAVLVQHCGRAVLAQGYGLADVARGVPVTPESRFELASVSKQFTALAMLRMAADRVISLDDPVGRHVTELAGQPYGGVTLRQLLHHTSGVPDYLEMLEESGREDGPWLDNRAVIAMVRTRPAGPSFAPGERFEYSNSGYVLLAEVVARAGRTTYASYLRERIFTPLAMPDATVMSVSRQVIPGRVVPYAREGRTFSVNDYEGPTVGDGGVVASLRDFTRLQAAWTSAAIVSSALIETAWTSGRTNSGVATGYGFGWAVRNRSGARWISHGGSYVGFRTHLALAPERGLMIVVLANRDDFEPDEVALRVERAWGETVGAEVPAGCAP